MDIEEIRRRNVRKVINDKYGGVVANLAEAINKPAGELYRRLKSGTKESRNFGRQFRELTEQAADLPRGWLDIQHKDSGYITLESLEAINDALQGLSQEEADALLKEAAEYIRFRRKQPPGK